MRSGRSGGQRDDLQFARLLSSGVTVRWLSSHGSQTSVAGWYPCFNAAGSLSALAGRCKPPKTLAGNGPHFMKPRSAPWAPGQLGHGLLFQGLHQDAGR